MSYNLALFPYLDSLQVRFYSVPVPESNDDSVSSGDIDLINSNYKLGDSSLLTDNDDISFLIDSNDTLPLDNVNHSKTVSANRCKNSIYNIARSNYFDMFLTLTFDREKVDSSNWDSICYYYTRFLKELKRIYPNVKILTVPELHADKTHYHFHSLCSGIPDYEFIDTGLIKNDSKIYNFPRWEYGFSTMSFIKDSSRCSSYIGKYVTKDLLYHLKGKKRYFATRNCFKTVPKKLNIDVDLLKKFLIDRQPDYIKSVANGEFFTNYIEFNFNDISEYSQILEFFYNNDLTYI